MWESNVHTDTHMCTYNLEKPGNLINRKVKAAVTLEFINMFKNLSFLAFVDVYFGTSFSSLHFPSKKEKR